jgi:hypothetical protein
VVIGDSVTRGVVPLDALYTRQFERLLRQSGMKVEVVTIGCGGWSTDQELEALRLEGLAYDPDVVLVQFDANDLDEVLSPYVGMDKKKLYWAKPFRYDLSPDGQLVRLSKDNPRKGNPDLQSGIKLVEALYREMKRITEKQGAQFVIFADGPYSYMQQLCASVPAECYIPSHPYTMYKKDTHPNAIGNTEMALDLTKYFLKRYGH